MSLEILLATFAIGSVLGAAAFVPWAMMNPFRFFDLVPDSATAQVRTLYASVCLALVLVGFTTWLGSIAVAFASGAFSGAAIFGSYAIAFPRRFLDRANDELDRQMDLAGVLPGDQDPDE